uniref:SAP30-binding protein-like n=1 Tax=Ciona intestinalis TaxID=7719 RepID=UPI00089DAEB7|nr:SAP30-binding protein-like [Ciona intestinalis]|eukprot:XP_026693850.1 SAP30-binding protein-like [Ciona intestinalis]
MFFIYQCIGLFIMASLAALAAYDVSDGDTDAEHSENGGSPVDTTINNDVEVNEEEEENKDEIDDQEDMETTVVELEQPAVKIAKKRYSCENATALAVKLRTLDEDDLHLPPEPEGSCSVKLQQKISRHYERKMQEGKDLNQAIQSRKDFRNPSIYEKLIAYLAIDELGSNFPKEEFNPDVWKKMPTYDELARLQREEIAKKDKKTKVEFVTAVKQSTSGTETKKTKWDKIDSKTQSTNSNKTTVISAVGNLKKSKS